MPSRNTNIWYDTAPTTAGNYGAVNIGMGNILMRVEVRACIAFPAQETSYPNPGFTANVVMGIQLLDYPSSFLDLPADIDDPGWLTIEVPGTDAVEAIAWSPSTADVAANTAGFVTQTWAGSIPMNVPMQLCWTTGLLGGTPPGWHVFGSLQYWLA